MAKNTGRKFAIIENEFSEFSVDGPLLESFRDKEANIEDLEITELSEGCICCTGKVDFQSTVVTVQNAINPDYLVVEPSGVAHPSMILSNLRPILYEQIRILAPITIIDANNFKKARKEFMEYFDDQLNTARIVILSKSENLTVDEIKRIKDDLGIGEDKFFPLEHYSNWTREDWDRLFKEELVFGEDDYQYVEDEAEKANETPMLNMAIRPFGVKSIDHLIYLLDQINTGDYGDIYRAKGFTGSGDTALRFEYVGGTYEITGFDTEEEPVAVVIGKTLKRRRLKELFDSVK